MTWSASPSPILFLDYQVLDHMHRLDTDMYDGPSAAELTALRRAAILGAIEVWMSRITLVEMAIGLENPKLNPAKLVAASQRDMDKLAIASSMRVRWLTYPANKSDDTYSREGLTLRSDGLLDWPKAKALEERLLKLPERLDGDVQQVVSCVYGRAEDEGWRPAVKWFVTEDRRLEKVLKSAKAANTLGDLAGIQVCSVRTFVDGMNKWQ